MTTRPADIINFRGDFDYLCEVIGSWASYEVSTSIDPYDDPNTGRPLSSVEVISDTVTVQYENSEGEEGVIFTGGKAVFHSMAYGADVEVEVTLKNCEFDGENWIAFYDYE